MTKTEFMKKWSGHLFIKDTWWAETPSKICWALSYGDTSQLAYDVCKDFIDLDYDNKFSSVLERAVKIIQQRGLAEIASNEGGSASP